MKRPLGRFVLDAISMPLYWAVSPRFFGWLATVDPHSMKAGLNAVVDERRLLTIRMKLARGQKYLTAHDGRFLLAQLDNDRSAR